MHDTDMGETDGWTDSDQRLLHPPGEWFISRPF